MATPQKDFTLQVRRTFPKSQEVVFAAWADPQKLKLWMCKDVAHHDVHYRELEIRPGGRYVLEIYDSKNGQTYIGSGTYREVAPPNRLSFTWSWQKRMPDGTTAQLHEERETLVTVEFFARDSDSGPATELVLTHTGFLSQAAHDEHNGGWNGCLDVLATALPI
jgi:uncharacterized protein YndB with AHSA1/START domain